MAATEANAIPKRISARWLSNQRGILGMTVATLGDGAPNPARVALEAEVTEAAAELARWEAFEGWVKAELGMALNLYPLRTKTQTYEAGKVFLRKDTATGETTFLAPQAAWEKYTAATN